MRESCRCNFESRSDHLYSHYLEQEYSNSVSTKKIPEVAWDLQLVCSSCTDSVDSCLVICENEVSIHIMWLRIVSKFVLFFSRKQEINTSFISPKITFSLFANLPASSPQNAANSAVVAAAGSEVSPIILPLVGC
jgi:hypothetical protein